MCRHLAYLGARVRLGELLSEPPNALVAQSWRPRRQTEGVVNADGFGVGWYVDGHPEPARHRGAGPIWADETFADLARVIRTTALLAAVRSATPGTAPGVAAAAPFRSGRWLFSHNGRIVGWPKASVGLAAALPPERLLTIDARTDSALLWAATLELLEAGATPADALSDVVHRVAAAGEARLTLLLTDGRHVVGTRYGPSLVWRARPGGVVVASEPYDDEPGWVDVPDRHLVVADPGGVRTTPL